MRETERKKTTYDDIVLRYVLIGKLVTIISRNGTFKNNQKDAAGFSVYVSDKENLISGRTYLGLRVTPVAREILRFA
jgi:hypothetical protein